MTTAGGRPGRCVVIGVGVASAATVEEVAALVAMSLAEAGMTSDDVTAVATIESRRDHPAIAALGLPVVAFPPEELGQPDEPGRQGPRGPAGGRPAVAEPAALRAAGAARTAAVLLVPKRRSDRATVAVAAATPSTAEARASTADAGAPTAAAGAPTDPGGPTADAGAHTDVRAQTDDRVPTDAGAPTADAGAKTAAAGAQTADAGAPTDAGASGASSDRG
jgi:hypothetical protein